MGYLSDFYNGNKNPQDRTIVPDSRYEKELHQLTAIEEKLMDLLQGDSFDLFADYLIQSNMVLGIVAEDNFVAGYRHGVQCLLDALDVEIDKPVSVEAKQGDEPEDSFTGWRNV